MRTEERRKAIAELLLARRDAVSGSALGEQFSVSRQIIVKDIASLKEKGFDILSTPKGYIIQKSPLVERVFKLKHTTNETEKELSTIVGLGGTVVDVFVWHKVYGKVQIPLNIATMAQVQEFLEGVRTGKSTELMHITGGYHYHTVRAEKEEILDKIQEALKDYIAPEIDYSDVI